MRLTYQTGIAALVHLTVITLFNVVNGVSSTVSQCHKTGNGCVENIILNLLYFMLITFWFAMLWIVAAAAQERRSRKLALAVMGGEFLVFVVSLFNAHQHTGLLPLVTSLADLTLATWVGFLALRIFIAGGGRVTTAGRGRRRRLSS